MSTHPRTIISAVVESRIRLRDLAGVCLVGLFCVACTAEAEQTEVEPAEAVVDAEMAESFLYDQVPPEITQWMTEPAILVFSKTRAWRHNEGIAGADRFFADLAQEEGLGFFTTVNGAVFNAEDLARFDVIIFNNMTGDALSPDQELAFRTWLEAGGSWIGLHGAGDNSHTDWSWYDSTLIGPEFTSHPMAPQFQEATLVKLNDTHPIMQGLPDEFILTDEWYSFDGVPGNFGLTALVGLDESTYSPVNNSYGELSDLSMGPEPEDHPIIWAGTVGEGRIVYSAVGHNQTNYDDETYAQFLKQAFDWVRASE